MSDAGHRFVLEIKDGGRMLEAAPFADFERARQRVELLARLEGLEAGAEEPGFTIEPVWGRNRPYISGFRAKLREGGREVSQDFPLAFFRNAACRRALVLDTPREEGTAEPEIEFQVSAFPGRTEAAPTPGIETIRSERTPLRLQRSDPAALKARAQAVGGGEDPFPCYIEQAPLDEMLALSRRSPDAEVGGCLVGHVRVDPATRTPFVHVTAQIEARFTEASKSHVKFTSQTWVDAERVLRLRNRGEEIVGFAHSHWPIPVVKCSKCDLPETKTCSNSSVFFSLDDIRFMEAIFPRATALALVTGRTARGEAQIGAFGWSQDGLVVRRGYHALAPEPRAQELHHERSA